MIYIEKLELKNFQSHGYTEINFDRGLNVILGNSDSGKTAIIRAIKWVLYNEPRGDYFIKQGEKNVSVKITLSTGAVVERYRTPSKNGYYMVKPDGTEQRFESFGSTIPKEIIDLTNIYPVSFEKNKSNILNIASQLEGPFLLDESASTRASAIGRLIGVNYIDDALRNVRRDSLKISSEVSELETKKNSLKDELAKYDYLESYKEIYKKISEYRSKIEALEKKKELLEKYRSNISDLNKKIILTSNELENYTNVERLEQELFKADQQVFTFKKLSEINNKIKNVSNDLNTTSEKLNSLKNIDEFKNFILKIDKEYEVLKRFHSYRERYSIITRELKKVSEENKNYKNLDEINKLLSSVQVYIKKFNTLFEYNSNYKSISKSLNIGNDYYSKNFKNIEDLIQIIDYRLILLVDKLTNVSKISYKLKEIEKDISNTNKNIATSDDDIKSISDKYESIIIKSNVCPFCFSEINEDSIEHIKYHLRND